MQTIILLFFSGVGPCAFVHDLLSQPKYGTKQAAVKTLNHLSKK